jgi:hypothetical protein
MPALNELALTDDSFLTKCGGTDLAVSWHKTQCALAKMEHLNTLWARSNTSWSINNLTLTASGTSPWKQLRQVSAEIERKKMALSEAKWSLLRLDVEIAKARRNAETEEDVLEQKLIAIEIGEKEDRIAMILQKFDGAMRDVADLERNYDRLTSDLGGEITEDRINAAEREAHLKRALSQSIRSVRYCGVIDPGNQEYLEQIGVNPSHVLNAIKLYVEDEAKACAASTPMDDFVNSITVGIIGIGAL